MDGHFFAVDRGAALVWSIALTPKVHQLAHLEIHGRAMELSISMSVRGATEGGPDCPYADEGGVEEGLWDLEPAHVRPLAGDRRAHGLEKSPGHDVPRQTHTRMILSSA